MHKKHEQVWFWKKDIIVHVKKTYIVTKKENDATFKIIYWIRLQRIVKKSCCTLMGQKSGHKGDVWDLRTEFLYIELE